MGSGSGGGCTLLLWLAGDVSRYDLVEYVPPERLSSAGEHVRSVMAAAALNEWISPDRVMVIVPSTLFAESHCESYRRLLEAKSRYKGSRLLVEQRGEARDGSVDDEHLHTLLDKGFSCSVVRHPVRAAPLVLEERSEGSIMAPAAR